MQSAVGLVSTCKTLFKSSTLPSRPLEDHGHILRFCDVPTLAVSSRVSLAFLELSIPLLHDEVHIQGMAHLAMFLCCRDDAPASAVDTLLSVRHVRLFTLACRGGFETPEPSLDRLDGRTSLSVGHLTLLVHRQSRPDRIDDDITGGVYWCNILPFFDPESVRAEVAELTAEPDWDASSDEDSDQESNVASTEYVRSLYRGGCSTCGHGEYSVAWDDGLVPELACHATSWSRLRSIELFGVKPTWAMGRSDFVLPQPGATTSAGLLTIIYVMYSFEMPGSPSDMFKSVMDDLKAFQPAHDLFGSDKRPVKVVIRVGTRRQHDEIKEMLAARAYNPGKERYKRVLGLVEYEITEEVNQERRAERVSARDDGCDGVDAAQSRPSALEL